MDITLPVWRVGECLLHAERLAAAVVADLEGAEIEVQIVWDGLQGREMTAWASPMRFMAPRLNRGQASVRSELAVPAAGLAERLPEVVQALTRPLYESFDFFEPRPAMFREELDALRGRRQR